MHLALANLTPRAIVTTNHDSLIERALVASGRNPEVVTNDEVPATEDYAADRVLVYKITSSREEGQDSRTLSRRVAPSWPRLKSILSVSLVLVAGFPINSPELHDVYEGLAGDEDASSWVLLTDDFDRISESLWRSRGVQVLEAPSIILPDLLARLGDSAPISNLPMHVPEQILVLGDGDRGLEDPVRRMLDRLGVRSVSLMDEPGRGFTLLEKLEHLSRSASAAIVMVGDVASQRPLRRENLMFELGMLVGRMGRERVIIIVPKGQQLPSDVGGLEYPCT